MQLRDVYLDMIQDGIYEQPKSTICASISQLLRDNGAGNNADSYCRYVLDAEYKDTDKTTISVLMKRSFNVKKSSNLLADNEGTSLNLFESWSTNDLNNITKSEAQRLKEEYDDAIKESKRRIRENRQVLAAIIGETATSAISDNNINMTLNNELFKELLTTLKTGIKKIRRIYSTDIIDTAFTKDQLESMIINAQGIDELCDKVIINYNLK